MKKQISEIFNDLCNAPTGGVKDDFTISTLKDSHSDLFIRTIAGHLASLNYCKHSENIIELPCKVGDYVRFKGLESPWKVSAIHIYAEGAPQISLTSGLGKVTSTLTVADFEEFAALITSEHIQESNLKTT